MNGIVKCLAVVLVITFGLNACGGETSGESTGTMTNTNTSGLSAAAISGLAVYEGSNGCSGCHGRDGQGTALAPSPINTSDPAVCATCGSVAMLTAYNDAAMPLGNPTNCVGICASDVSAYIYEKFIQGAGGNNNPPPPPTPAINVNPTSGLTTTEAAAGMASFTVLLNTQPTVDVVIGLSSSDTTEGSVNPAMLTFTTLDWDQPQTVMITGVDDALLDGNVAYTIVTAPAATGDVDYSGMDAADVSVTNTDDEVPPPGVITVNPTSGLVTDENGLAATFTIVLGTVPTADVTIGLSSSNTLEGTVLPASVAFNAANYNMAQTVTVTGVDDAAAPMVDGNIAYSIVTGAAISADPSYSGLNATDVMVTNNDNDVQPAIMTFTSDAVANVPYAGNVTLTWTSDADACTAGGATANGQWAGALNANDSRTLTNLITSGVNTFMLTCTKGGIDSVPASVNVTVDAQPGAPTVTLTANPMVNVAYNGSSALTWSTVNATSCVATSTPANATWDNANKPVNGVNEVIANLTTASNTFTLACTNAGGLVTTVNTNVTVVQPNPTLTLTVDNANVIIGDSVTLTWNTTDLASCTASSVPANAAWTGAKGVLATQNEVIPNLQASTAFTLACVGINGANVTQTVNVTAMVDPDLALGKVAYETQCFFCHGPAGEVVNPAIYNFPIGPNMCSNSLLTVPPMQEVCGDQATLEGYLTTYMPTLIGTPVDCVGDCARSVAKYILNNFQAQ